MVESQTEKRNGWVEESPKTESELQKTADLTVKVPKIEYQNLMDSLRSRLDVESYNVKNYRISTSEETDELDILNTSINDYENMRSEIKRMETNEEKMDLLMKLTEKELELRQKRQNFEGDIQDKEERAKYATVEIELEQKRTADLLPDNVWNRFKA